MTITNSNTLTKEKILCIWNIDKKMIRNKISNLLTTEYFQESHKKIYHQIEYCGNTSPLTEDEKKELDLFREIFEWKENYKISSMWQFSYSDTEEDYEDSVEDIRKILEHEYPDEDVITEPTGNNSHDWTSRVIGLEPRVEISDLQIKESPKSVKEQLSFMSERISAEGEKYQGIINELRSHKDDPSYHFEDIEHLFHLFISMPIGLTDLCKKLEAQLEDKTND